MADDHAAGPFRYRAFISYSHKDMRWGKWLHRELEGFRVPRALVGRQTRMGAVPRLIRPVYRDVDELPTAASLPDAIRQALEDAACLIVICSPSARASNWVQQEIKTFKAMKKQDRVLALIVDGEPNADAPGKTGEECFPEAMRYVFDDEGRPTSTRTEPIGGDVRYGQSRRVALLKVAAGVIGVGFDELYQRHKRETRRQWLVRSAVAAMLIVVFAVMGRIAWVRHREATEARDMASSLRELRTLTGDSPFAAGADGFVAEEIEAIAQQTQGLRARHDLVLARFNAGIAAQGDLSQAEYELYMAEAQLAWATKDQTLAIDRLEKAIKASEVVVEMRRIRWEEGIDRYDLLIAAVAQRTTSQAVLIRALEAAGARSSNSPLATRLGQLRAEQLKVIREQAASTKQHFERVAAMHEVGARGGGELDYRAAALEDAVAQLRLSVLEGRAAAARVNLAQAEKCLKAYTDVVAALNDVGLPPQEVAAAPDRTAQHRMEINRLKRLLESK